MGKNCIFPSLSQWIHIVVLRGEKISSVHDTDPFIKMNYAAFEKGKTKIMLTHEQSEWKWTCKCMCNTHCSLFSVHNQFCKLNALSAAQY